MKKISSISRIFTLVTLLFVGLGSAWATSYTLVESAPQDWSGNYLLVAKNGDTYYAWDGTFGSWGTAVAVANTELSNSNKTITPGATSTIQPITISAVSGGYTISDGTSYLAATDKKFNSSETAVTFGYFAIDNAGNTIIQKTNNGSNDYGVRYNYSGGSGGFRVYKTQTTASAVYLYKADGAGDTRTAVNITSFTATTSELTLGGTTTTTTTVANDQNGWTPAYTYNSSNTNVATVDANGLVTAVADGTADITVSLNIANDDANWKKGATYSKTVTITVVDPNAQNLSTTFDFVNENYGLTQGADMQGAFIAENTVVYSDLVNIKFAASSAARYGTYSSKAELRIYKSKDIKFSVPAGCKITKITLDSREDKYHYPAQNGTDPVIWTGKAEEVTIQFVGSTQVIQTIKVDYQTPQPQPVQLTVSSAQYATYYNSIMAYIMPTGLEGITVEGVSVIDKTLTLVTRYSDGDVVPAGEALILHATSKLIEATNFALNPGTNANEPIAANLLKGTSRADQQTIGGDTYYRLSQHDGQVGFYYGAEDGAAFKPGANKAYLAVSGTNAPARFIFGQQDVPTELQNVSAETVSRKVVIDGRLYILRDGNMFDLNGRLVK